MHPSSEKNILKACWSAPSNIALVKYWGKKDVQRPLNPNVSLTLSHARTSMQLNCSPGEGKIVSFHFEGKEAEQSFIEKMNVALERMSGELGWIAQHDFEIKSRNTFPHSAGIASSASSMAALALCLVDVWQQSTGQQLNELECRKKVSTLARLGSGSASRSVFGGSVVWGEDNNVESSDDWASPFQGDESLVNSLHDAILIIDSGKKEFSSSVGHSLMDGHPFREARIEQARSHFENALKAMGDGNMEQLGEISEKEALSLHAMMLTSDPSYTLMKPNTLAALEKIRSFRNESGCPVYFTLDAGPNVHVLYRGQDKEKVEAWISQELAPLCENHRVIYDRVGDGPVREEWND